MSTLDRRIKMTVRRMVEVPRHRPEAGRLSRCRLNSRSGALTQVGRALNRLR
jgi:hypothetical protein